MGICLSRRGSAKSRDSCGVMMPASLVFVRAFDSRVLVEREAERGVMVICDALAVCPGQRLKLRLFDLLANFQQRFIGFAVIGLDYLNAARANVRPFLVLGVAESSGSAVGPILGSLPAINSFPHSVLDALRVFPRVLLGVMAN